jgi:hypothetical protein
MTGESFCRHYFGGFALRNISTMVVFLGRRFAVSLLNV